MVLSQPKSPLWLVKVKGQRTTDKGNIKVKGQQRKDEGVIPQNNEVGSNNIIPDSDNNPNNNPDTKSRITLPDNSNMGIFPDNNLGSEYIVPYSDKSNVRLNADNNLGTQYIITDDHINPETKSINSSLCPLSSVPCPSFADKGNVLLNTDNEDNPESVFQESNNSHLETFPDSSKNPDAIQEINCEELEILPDNLKEINAPCFISKAIAYSPILQEIEDKIILVEKQINYLEEKVAYYKSRNWTDYITMDAVKFVQNLFGGGEVQKTQLTITDLEIKSDALRIELINLEKEKVIKEEEIKLSVVEYLDKLQEIKSKIQLLRKQQDNFSIAFNTFLVKYQNGKGSTEQYLNYQDKQEKLEFQLLQLQNDYRQTLNKLSLLLGEN